MNQRTRTNSVPGRHTRIFASAALALAAASYVPVSSALIFDELSKDELSLIRGKFLPRGGTHLRYFGLSMNTTWGTPSRATHTARLGFNVDFSNATPRINVSSGGTLGATVDNAAGPEVNPALQQISGSVQHVQIGGNDNTVVNDIELAVSESATATYDSPASAAPDSPTSTAPLAAGVSTYQSDDGVVTQFTNTQNTLGYTVQTDAGLVVQQLGANLMQSAIVSGNAQSILNHIKLDVGLANRPMRQTALHMTGHSALFGLR